MDLETVTIQFESISADYAQKFSVERTADWFLLKLTEEVGELIQSYLRYAGQARENDMSEAELRRDLENELADVLGMTLLVANHYNIDLEDAVSRKWLVHLSADLE